jgi:ankyrin repeat protein
MQVQKISHSPLAYIPIISSLLGIGLLARKALSALQRLISPSPSLSSRTITPLSSPPPEAAEEESAIRDVVMLVPLAGNLTLYLYDRYQAQHSPPPLSLTLSDAQEALFAAIRRGDLEQTGQLLHLYGHYPQFFDPSGYLGQTPLTALLTADTLSPSAPAIAKLLLKARPSLVNEQNASGLTPIAILCARRYPLRLERVRLSSSILQLAALLADHQADLISADRHGLTPLMHAIATEQTDLIHFLLARNVDPYKKGARALMTAAQYADYYGFELPKKK